MSERKGGSMAEEKTTATRRAKVDEGETIAEAPGPITPEHESGSWEQTLADNEHLEKLPSRVATQKKIEERANA